MEWWELLLVTALVVVFWLMLLAVILVDEVRCVPSCYDSDPDPMRQVFLKCRECEHEEECLK